MNDKEKLASIENLKRAADKAKEENYEGKIEIRDVILDILFPSNCNSLWMDDAHATSHQLRVTGIPSFQDREHGHCGSSHSSDCGRALHLQDGSEVSQMREFFRIR